MSVRTDEVKLFLDLCHIYARVLNAMSILFFLEIMIESWNKDDMLSSKWCFTCPSICKKRRKWWQFNIMRAHNLSRPCLGGIREEEKKKAFWSAAGRADWSGSSAGCCKFNLVSNRQSHSPRPDHRATHSLTSCVSHDLPSEAEGERLLNFSTFWNCCLYIELCQC